LNFLSIRSYSEMGFAGKNIFNALSNIITDLSLCLQLFLKFNPLKNG
jgi:hypothetical protein